VVWAFPAVSATEKLPDAVNEDDTAPPPDVAVDVAATVHVVVFVWVIESMLAIFVVEKSAEVRVVQSIGSFPMTVKLIDAEDDEAAERAKVNVGGVVSAGAGMVTTTVAGDPEEMAV
jgi:hypothetical protein